MEKGKLYTIPATLWHNTVTVPDTKMILIEDPTTSNANSDVYELSEEQIAKLKEAVAQ